MASKRSASETSEEGQPAAKKYRYEHKKRRAAFVSCNQTFGQRTAFGDLATSTLPSDDDLDFEDETDALEYLRAVRREANVIPAVLVAKKAGPELPDLAGSDDKDGPVDRSIYTNGVGDALGFFCDGAYISQPDEDNDANAVDAENPHDSSPTEIHNRYHVALMNQFQKLRTLLQSKPPKGAIRALSEDHPTHVGHFGQAESFKNWSQRLHKTDPLPAQVASMNKESVLRLLRILLKDKTFLAKTVQLQERTSRWIWAILARLPERGQLDYQEVGWIRELGKRAVLCMLSLAEVDVLEKEYGVDGADGQEYNSDPEVLGEAEEEVEEEIDEEVDEDSGDHTYGEDEEGEETEQLDQEEVKIEQTDDKQEERKINSIPGTPEQTAGANRTADMNDKSSIAVARNTATAATVTTKFGPNSSLSAVDVQLYTEMQNVAETDVASSISNPASPQQEEQPTDLQAAKARLLADLDVTEDDGNQPRQEFHEKMDMDKYEEEEGAHEKDLNQANRVKDNARATLNMILTVVGEFHGQRDLLEFRDPFGSISG